MRGKTKVELWKHALKELQRSAPSTRGMKDKVYKPLKWSYDSLEGNKTKACFLYCALFPEDYSIEVSELVWYWLAEGLIDEQQTFEDSVNNGISLIETLKDCCLLEDGNSEGTVKMHDVVRDVAIWIASSLEDECISLIRSGIGLSEICEVELSNSLKRVSFMNNRINELPESEIQCSNASTLLLQGNFPLKDVPERFIQGFRALRVFNISGTQIQSLPPLLQLGDLRALLLGNCYYLEELPSLEQLSRLLVLDLRATGIRQLPKEMENLINLKKVNLSYTYDLKDIQGGIMSKWTCLEVLDMKFSAYHWGMKEEVEEGQTSLEELRCLKQLFLLSIGLKSIPCLCSEDLLWISRLRVFELLIGPTANSLPTRLDERWVTFGGLDLSGQWIEWSFVNATSLVLDGCKGLDKMLEDLAISSVFSFANTNSFGSFVGLKSLTLTSSDSAIQPAGGCGAPSDLLPNLEELHLEDLQGIKSISELVGHLGLTFSKLKLIEVSNCYKMKCLLTCGNFIVSLENLETIKVRSCHNLDVLFNNVSAQNSGARVVVPNIRRLELLILNKLSNFCTPVESWPSLEHVSVLSCQLLSKLPLTIQNADTIKEIRGESYWWSKLEWDNDDTKSALQPYFRPY